MKRILIGIFLLTIFNSIAQSTTIQNLQAVKDGNQTLYNTEGYDVAQIDFELYFDEKGFRKVKNKLGIPKETPIFDSPDFPNVKVIEQNVMENGIVSHSIYFLSTPRWGILKVVAFGTSCSRVPAIEKELYTEIIKKTLPKSVFTSLTVDTVMFAGRPVDFGPPCQWMGPRNLQCPNHGQMNWSEFTDSVRARQMITNQKIRNDDPGKYSVLEQKQVDVIFEGQEVKALRCTLKINIPELIMGGSNVLIVYYVNAKVRDRYVSCVLSQYTDDVGVKTNKLAQLLAQVMQLKE
ncbi:hypothetical protein [Fluviicola sp.]|uniref:hypothetical protein n=1 Tax=Fluviicola sp. TaxID=1917219 RepID=UPI003D28A598